MIQIFLKKSKISENDWNKIYQKINILTHAFPLKLERLQSYNGFSKELDKVYFDLIDKKGETEENISFWGDEMSYSAKYKVYFYKNWVIECEKLNFKNEKFPDKPIYWAVPEVFDFSGYIPEVNGMGLLPEYLDTGACYKYAIIAIGILCENMLPGRAMLIAMEDAVSEIQEVIKWMEGATNEKYDLPIYFDKHKMLDMCRGIYNNEKDLVARMDLLYGNKFMINMEFAIENIGYQPALEYYAHALSNSGFGTMGFSDILHPWIAATKDLEKTLQLLQRSYEIALSDKDNTEIGQYASKYTLTKILTELLDMYILWTPEQCEILENFYTNKQTLETGKEDLWGFMYRMVGFRINICPIHLTKEQLFETFMFFDPKNALEYQNIIENWIIKNENTYQETVVKIEDIVQKVSGTEELKKFETEELNKEMDAVKLESEIDSFVLQYPEHERFLIKKALENNPAYMRMNETIEKFQNDLYQLINNESDKNYIYRMLHSSHEDQIEDLRHFIKKKRLSVHPEFEEWIQNEKDGGILTMLSLMITLKITPKEMAFARQQILLDKKYWAVWKKGGKFALKLENI